MNPVRRLVEWLLIAGFLVAISLPLLGKLLPREGSFALTENRRPAAMPTIRVGGPGWGWSIASFPRRFERYWNDSFAFRWYLIRAHSVAKLALGASPSPKAIVGLGGYLFYAADSSLDYYRRVRPFDEAGLARWAADLDRRRTWLAERGIRYLVVVAPNKETIYPEFMPPAYRPLREASRLDQLVDYLRTSGSSVELLDLREPLIAAKKRQRVYHKTDTHWNDAGALLAAESLLLRLKQWFPQIDATPPVGTLTSRTGPGGDLARVLALEDRFEEEYFEWQRPGAPAFARIEDGTRSRSVSVTVCTGCTGPVVVMNQDSFNEALAPFLADRFARLVRVDGTRLDERLIERERPAVVIQQFVERTLMCRDLRC